MGLGGFAGCGGLVELCCDVGGGWLTKLVVIMKFSSSGSSCSLASKPDLYHFFHFSIFLQSLSRRQQKEEKQTMVSQLVRTSQSKTRNVMVAAAVATYPCTTSLFFFLCHRTLHLPYSTMNDGTLPLGCSATTKQNTAQLSTRLRTAVTYDGIAWHGIQ